MKVKHLLYEILKNGNKKRNETLVSRVLSYECSYEQYLRFIFIMVTFISGIFQLKKIHSRVALSTPIYADTHTHMAKTSRSKADTEGFEHNALHQATQKCSNANGVTEVSAEEAADNVPPDKEAYAMQMSSYPKSQPYSHNDLQHSENTQGYNGDEVYNGYKYNKTSEPIAGDTIKESENNESIGISADVSVAPYYEKRSKLIYADERKDEAYAVHTQNEVPYYASASAYASRSKQQKLDESDYQNTLEHVFPYSRYAIIEEHSGPLYCITKPLQFYSNLLPVWMVAELLIGLNSRKRSNYIIRRINCWNNAKRLDDIVGIHQICESINTIIYSLNKEKIRPRTAWKPIQFLCSFTHLIGMQVHFARQRVKSSVNNALRNQSDTSALHNYASHRNMAGSEAKARLHKHAQNYLFVGPSGTGKTVLAQAIAGSSGVSMFCTTLSELQSSSLTTGPAHLRTLFQKAKIHKPSLIVLENLELIGQIRKQSTTYLDIQLFTELLVALTPTLSYSLPRNISTQSVSCTYDASESEEIHTYAQNNASCTQSAKRYTLLNKMNTQIQRRILQAGNRLRTLWSNNAYSGITVEPNILIGTTDNIEKLDPALIRPGRFNRVIYFSHPNSKDRVRLLKHLTNAYESSVNAFSLNAYYLKHNACNNTKNLVSSPGASTTSLASSPVRLPVEYSFRGGSDTQEYTQDLQSKLDTQKEEKNLLLHFARKTIHYTHAHLYVLVNESKLQSVMQFFTFNLPWFVIHNEHFGLYQSLTRSSMGKPADEPADEANGVHYALSTKRVTGGLHSGNTFTRVYNRLQAIVLPKDVMIFIKRYTHKIAKFNKVIFCVFILAVIFAQNVYKMCIKLHESVKLQNQAIRECTKPVTAGLHATEYLQHKGTELGKPSFFHLQKAFYDMNKYQRLYSVGR